jgi:hypothetical protein
MSSHLADVFITSLWNNGGSEATGNKKVEGCLKPLDRSRLKVGTTSFRRCWRMRGSRRVAASAAASYF